MAIKNSIIKKCTVLSITAPLIQPFRTALGDHNSLENLLFSIQLSDGTCGYGEAAIATHITGETIAKTEANLRKAGEKLVGQDIFDYLQLLAGLREALRANMSAVAAIETAVLDALTRELKMPLWRFFGPRAYQLATDITIVIADLDETEASVRRFYNAGFRAFKVKVGRDRDLDVKRVAAVRRIAGAKAQLYIDANQGYTADDTLAFLKELARLGIVPDLVEQPVPKEDWEGLKRVTRLSKSVICADESAKTVKDCLRIIKEGAAGAINIKTMKSGLIEAREIAGLSLRAGIKLMIGGMMETSLAMTTSAHLAAGIGGFSYIDLDTPFFIKGGAEKNPYLNDRGRYDLKSARSGIGITPKEIR